MPVVALVLLGFCQGLLFCWTAAEDLRQREGALRSEGSWIVLLYCTLVQATCAGYLMTFHGDWALSYGFSAANLPGAVTAGLCFVGAAAPFVGWVVGSPFARQRRSAPLLYLGAAAALLTVVGGLLSLGRLLVVGSSVEFRNDFGTKSIAGSPLGYSLLWMTMVVGIATLWTTSALRQLHLRIEPRRRATTGRLK